MKNLKFIALTGLLSFIILPLTASAFYFGADEGLVIEKKIEDDAYLAGQSIFVEEKIDGDAFLAGGELVINAEISQDAVLAAEKIKINAPIGDDLKIAGEKLDIDSVIGSDVMSFGSKMELSDDSKIGGDLLFMGEEMNLEGEIQGDVIGFSTKLYLNAVVNGNLKLNYAEEIILGPEAKIEGNLTYTGLEKNDELEKIVGGSVEYKSPDQSLFFSTKVASGVVIWVVLFLLLSGLIIGLVILGFLRYFDFQLTQAATKHPLKSMGFGLLLVFAFPIIIALLMATGAAIPLALILLFAWIVMLYLSKLLACMIIAGKLFNLNEKSRFVQRFFSFALVLAIYDALLLVPALGLLYENGALLALGSLINLAKFTLGILSLGALMIYKWDLFKAMRKKKLI